MKALIFDLDGVIVDTAKYHYIAWKNIAKQVGFELSPMQNQSLKGISRVESLERILKWANVTLSEAEKNDLLHQKNEEYLLLISNMGADEIMPGVVSVLQYAQKENIPVALGSASKNATRILQKLGLSPYFNAIVDGNHVSKSKPDPEVFLRAAHLLKHIPEHCMVFEDAAAGIQAAKTAGMITIGMGGEKEVNTADYTFTSMEEVTAFLISNF
jgi:beta-phosphoglucomutase